MRLFRGVFAFGDTSASQAGTCFGHKGKRFKFQEYKRLDCLQKHFIMPWVLQNDNCNFLPLSSIGHPAGHKKSHKNEHFEKVAFLVQFPYITASFC